MNTTGTDFTKLDGLIPVIVQHAETSVVLMLGFMNEEALQKTRDAGRVTFYSRSKKRLWTKGETSGNYLQVKEILPDCDNDTLLIKAIPTGAVCHTGEPTCFKSDTCGPLAFISQLEQIINSRKADARTESYTASLFKSGLNRIAQKVGEEAVEVVIAAKDSDSQKFREEAADLLFHYLVLLSEKNVSLSEIAAILKSRNTSKGE